MKFQCRSKYDTEHDLVQEFIKYSVNNFNDNSKGVERRKGPLNTSLKLTVYSMFTDCNFQWHERQGCPRHSKL